MSPADPTRADPDPSLTSHYVSNDFYDALVAAFADWRRDDREIADPARRDALARLLFREARLLDEHRYDDWLALYAPECAYWVPGTAPAGDPRREIAIAFDDRRRLEDRVFRLKTGIAWSQAPESRTVRQVSNVEAFETGDPAVAMVRATFSIAEHRAGETRLWAGWSGHRVRREDENGDWRILVKQVNLIDYDRNLRNPSIVL